ncbi:hypothetical protein QFZ48_003065 [Chitinophaga sp. W2I13]|uniref:hypothetical protein n=1 Tax=Chitinophaga sp. W2I13 TaxID=3373923 RepID=UPI003D25670D
MRHGRNISKVTAILERNFPGVRIKNISSAANRFHKSLPQEEAEPSLPDGNNPKEKGLFPLTWNNPF